MCQAVLVALVLPQPMRYASIFTIGVMGDKSELKGPP